MNNRITSLLNIKYPVIQGGMVWASGWKLVSAVSNCGGLGLIGAGSMKPDLLSEHIKKCRNATDNCFGVNIPLLRDDAEELIKTSLTGGIKIFFTSAGHPGKFIDLLKKNNAIVTHVVSNIKQGLKAESVGCDAIVGEGVEAGGHNGADQITTLCLIPQLVDSVNIPVIAAGGIADGRQVKAVFNLGAEGVQIGTLFASSEESSAHYNYKRMIVDSVDNSTLLAFKQIGLVRLLKNDFALQAIQAELDCSTVEKMKELLGKKREMKGIFEGELSEGMFEAGQSSGLIKEILPVKSIFKKLLSTSEIFS
jgi:enoyl-[acyl-carrier protein] reductase II